MRRLFLIFAMTALACSQPVSNLGSKAYLEAPDLPAQAVVISANGLRLRDLPDTLGSQELIIIPAGSEFEIYYCIEVRGTDWAFGVYTNPENVHFLGYVASRYLSNPCP